MTTYLIVGAIFYAVLAIFRSHTFKGATLAGVIRGLVFGILMWPISALTMLYVFRLSWLGMLGYRPRK